MIGEVRIENYKSIQKLKLELGRVTVLIGENGCGKSNILEAIALASAAADDKLDNEFLASRGIRVTEPQFMRSAFEKENLDKDISIEIRGNNDTIKIWFILNNDNTPYARWRNHFYYGISEEERNLERAYRPLAAWEYNSFLDSRDRQYQFIRKTNIKTLKIQEFIIYSPENIALRTFEKEGQIQPLGINGEGLFKLLKFLNSDNQEQLNEIQKKLQLIDWFQDFESPPNLSSIQNSLQIKDRYLDPDLAYFDQRSSNEGFLFLLFYFALFISELTPNFFAIDNIDASLNPRLCRRLIEELVELAKKNDKQVILTTHNPAVLDGLDLDDDEQRLFAISRNQLGYTKATGILKPQPLEGQELVKLSEAFLRGYIGGLPKNF
ncbi:AAA family ATPase [Microcoleus sp. LEGE 07076]|uniref:AAA family ATPase n=1 Tax=Microcoleus sp. LEGE 07076 TaxID=915322 RepID=UPI00187EA5D7|nr:AAA family ATPase [Microcoleus sp. LEGE 07076]MBE9183364.1 AAA family ATPase [Microcoleus sp. LEGE 07076]